MPGAQPLIPYGEAREIIIAALVAGGHDVERVHIVGTDGFTRRMTKLRLIKVDGKLHLIHLLMRPRQWEGRNSSFFLGGLIRSAVTVPELPRQLYCLWPESDEGHLLSVPSRALFREFFRDTEYHRYTVYIREDGSPGVRFNFWRYRLKKCCVPPVQQYQQLAA